MAPATKSSEPMLRSAAAKAEFDAWKASQLQVSEAPQATAPDASMPDPRSVKWPLELMGCSKATHKSFVFADAFPETRKKLYEQHGAHSVEQFMLPGQPYPKPEPPPGADIFSTRPPAPAHVRYLSLSYTPTRSDGK